MNRIITIIICLLALTGSAQVTIMLYPVQGLELKPSDVFKATVQNQDAQGGQYYFVGTITNLTSGEKMVSAKSTIVNLLSGSTTLSESMLSPNYKVMSAVVSENGVFPYGRYRLCLQAFRVNIIEPVAEDCQEPEVTPMSPPLLLSPEHQSSITQEYPLLVWLPPMPVMKDPVFYDLKLVEVLPNQTAYDAVQRNFAVLEQQNIVGTTLQYPMNALKLEEGKKYAWKVVAKTQDRKPIGETEVWWFYKQAEHIEDVKEELTMDNNYIMLDEESNRRSVKIKNRMKIVCEDNKQSDTISYKIVMPKGGDFSKNNVEVVSEGDGKFVFNFNDTKAFVGVPLQLIVKTQTGRKRYVAFTFIKSK